MFFVEIWYVLITDRRAFLGIDNGATPTLCGTVDGGKMLCMRLDTVRRLCS